MSAPEQNISKIEAATRQLVQAIKLFFNHGDSVAIHVLGCGAGEVLRCLCERKNKETFLDHVKASNSQHSDKEIAKLFKKTRNFFLHADRDPSDVLEGFKETDNDHILFGAVHDCGLLFEGRMAPVEIQVFAAWYSAVNSNKFLNYDLRFLDVLFPEIIEMPRHFQKLMGRESIAWASNEQAFSPSFEVYSNTQRN